MHGQDSLVMRARVRGSVVVTAGDADLGANVNVGGCNIRD